MPDDGIPLIEPIPVHDEFCLGLARIEDLGSEARFVLYTDRVLYEAGDQPARVVCLKVVLPLSAIKEGVEMAIAFLARKAMRVAGDRILRLVKSDHPPTGSAA